MLKTEFYLPPLEKGNHTLIIQAFGAVVPNNLEIFYVNSTSTISFSVSNQTLAYYLLNQTFLTTVISLIAIEIAVIVSWSYFKKPSQSLLAKECKTS